jgi:hypothetical protein
MRSFLKEPQEGYQDEEHESLDLKIQEARVLLEKPEFFFEDLNRIIDKHIKAHVFL